VAFPDVEVSDPSGSFHFQLLDITFQLNQALTNRLHRLLIEILGFKATNRKPESVSLSHT